MLSYKALARSGFINYFGSQRFGSYGAPTSDIGTALLKRDWGQAVHLVLEPRRGEDQRCQDVRLFVCACIREICVYKRECVCVMCAYRAP